MHPRSMIQVTSGEHFFSAFLHWLRKVRPFARAGGYEEGRAGPLIMLGPGPDAMTLKGDISGWRKGDCAILARHPGEVAEWLKAAPC